MLLYWWYWKRQIFSEVDYATIIFHTEHSLGQTGAAEDVESLLFLSVTSAASHGVTSR